MYTWFPYVRYVFMGFTAVSFSPSPFAVKTKATPPVGGIPCLFSLFHFFYMPPQDERDNGDIIEWSKGPWWPYLRGRRCYCFIPFHSKESRPVLAFRRVCYSLAFGFAVSLLARTHSLTYSRCRWLYLQKSAGACEWVSDKLPVYCRLMPGLMA